MFLMELKILKYGNLMGSPDMKALMHDCADDAAADRLWDELYPIKLAFGLDGRSTSAVLIEPSCPELFPALVDCSYMCADPASYTDASVKAALDAIAGAGLVPAQIKSLLVTHPHGDHQDPRLLKHLSGAKFYADPASKIPGATPLPPDKLPSSFLSLDTPGHGTPHCSFIVDLAAQDLSVCIAGDLIMSHAHFLSLDHPLSFSDHAAGKQSVAAAMRALAARPTKHKMILPGHDMPFFVNAQLYLSGS